MLSKYTYEIKHLEITMHKDIKVNKEHQTFHHEKSGRKIRYDRRGPWIRIKCKPSVNEHGYVQHRGFRAATEWLAHNHASV